MELHFNTPVVSSSGQATAQGSGVGEVAVSAGNARLVLAGAASVQVLLDAMKAQGMARIQEFAALLEACSLHTLGSVDLFFPNLPALCEQLFADVPHPLGHLQACGYFASLSVRLFGCWLLACPPPCVTAYSAAHRICVESLTRR